MAQGEQGEVPVKTLEAQWLAAKAEFDRLAKLHGPRSIKAKAAHAKMQQLTARILRRDNRRKAA